MFLANTSKLPGFAQLLDAMPDQRPLAVSQYLDIAPQTLRRWRAAQTAPRVALLAMYWESPWGVSLLSSTAQNGAMYARREVDGLKRENATLRGRIARLEALGNFGSANEPMATATRHY